MTTKEEIKAWLKASGTSRSKLAEKCGVTLSCVNNWLSNSKTNPIPPLKMQLIEKEMERKEENGSNATNWRAQAIMLSEEEIVTLNKISKGKPLDVVIRELALERMRQVLKGE